MNGCERRNDHNNFRHCNGNGGRNDDRNSQTNKERTLPNCYETKVDKITKAGYVDEAELIIESLKKNNCLLTTTKIRSILSLVSDLNDQLCTDSTVSGETIKEKCGYIRMRFAYETGRDIKVRQFVKNARLIELLKEIGKLTDEVEIKSKTELFCKYMEALVAYHKYNEGDDK